MIDKELCDKIKFIRKNISKNHQTGKPLSQAAFAKSLHTSQGIIADIETYKREPSKSLIRKIIEVYEINIFEDGTSVNKNTSQMNLLTYQLQEMKAEMECMQKELSRLKQKCLRLFMENEQLRHGGDKSL